MNVSPSLMWWQNTQCQTTRHDFISKMLPLPLLPALPIRESASSGRADGGGQLSWVWLCPCSLQSLILSIFVKGKHLRTPPPSAHTHMHIHAHTHTLTHTNPPPTPYLHPLWRCFSYRHVSAKLNLYTALIGPSSRSTRQFFSSACQSINSQREHGGMLRNAKRWGVGHSDENRIGLSLLVWYQGWITRISHTLL